MEVVVVLVVVGLLTGMVLQGQEMIAQGKVKRAIAEFSGIATAYQGYRDRYRQMPGDDPLTNARWPGAAAGNGNGVLSGRYNTTSASAESRLWWDHMRRAGLVSGSGSRQPANVLAGTIGVQFGDAGGGPALGGLRLMACSANLPDKIARAIDVQIDDGSGTGGEVRAAAQTSPNPDITDETHAIDYAETGTNVYVLCRALK